MWKYSCVLVYMEIDKLNLDWIKPKHTGIKDQYILF